MADKTFVTPQGLLDDSFRLGLKIIEDGFYPDYIIGIWRGGTPVGIAVQELLNYHGAPIGSYRHPHLVVLGHRTAE